MQCWKEVCAAANSFATAHEFIFYKGGLNAHSSLVVVVEAINGHSFVLYENILEGKKRDMKDKNKQARDLLHLCFL